MATVNFVNFADRLSALGSPDSTNAATRRYRCRPSEVAPMATVNFVNFGALPCRFDGLGSTLASLRRSLRRRSRGERMGTVNFVNFAASERILTTRHIRLSSRGPVQR